MQLARGRGQVLAREGDPEDVRDVPGARRQPGSEEAAEGDLPGGQGPLARLTLPAQVRERFPEGARLELQAMQLPVGFGDPALEVAQRVARLARVGLAAFQFPAEGFDARPEGGEVLLLRGRRGRRGREAGGRERRGGEEGGPDPAQAFALPCAATAASRRSTSAGSPR